jgi:hypothetical protein
VHSLAHFSKTPSPGKGKNPRMIVELEEKSLALKGMRGTVVWINPQNMKSLFETPAKVRRLPGAQMSKAEQTCAKLADARRR